MTQIFRHTINANGKQKLEARSERLMPQLGICIHLYVRANPCVCLFRYLYETKIL